MVLNLPRNTTLYNIAGTITFRLASKAITRNFKTHETWGTNLQNIAKDLRKIYVPDDGKIFVQVDQSGAEALIVAYLCEDGKFRSLFLNNVKPHVFVALHLFSDIWSKKLNEYSGDIKLDITELTSCDIPSLQNHAHWKAVDSLIKSSDNWVAAERYYYIAKQVCHSHNYDISPSAFQMNVLEKSGGRIALTKKQAQDYGAFYFSLFPEIKAWHRQVARQVEQTRMLFNLQGYPIYFSGVINEKSLKENYARIPQSTVACITRTATIRLQEFIEQTGLSWDILADTHDSYLCQCPVDEASECRKVMQQFMNQKLVSPRGEEFNMKSEAAVGFNWAPYKKGTNEQGMREVK
jgi:DNA polymerase I-like protein with 3'-5' exonuclease and polymerase domains